LIVGPREPHDASTAPNEKQNPTRRGLIVDPRWSHGATTAPNEKQNPTRRGLIVDPRWSHGATTTPNEKQDSHQARFACRSARAAGQFICPEQEQKQNPDKTQRPRQTPKRSRGL
jgi:hypothetical protein